MPSSSGFSHTLVIEHIRSRRVPVLLVMVGSLALVSIGLSARPWGELLMLVAAMLGVALWEGAAARPGRSRSVAVLHFAPSGEIQLGCRAEAQPDIPVTLGHFWVLPPDLVMGLEFVGTDGCRFQVLLCRDQVDAPTWRRLLVRLRIAGRDPVRMPV